MFLFIPLSSFWIAIFDLTLMLRIFITNSIYWYFILTLRISLHVLLLLWHSTFAIISDIFSLSYIFPLKTIVNVSYICGRGRDWQWLISITIAGTIAASDNTWLTRLGRSSSPPGRRSTTSARLSRGTGGLRTSSQWWPSDQPVTLTSRVWSSQ